MDATLISDSVQLMLKALEPSNKPEIEFFVLFSKESKRSARNHCVPFEGFLKMPNEEGVIAALPLFDHWDDGAVGEAIDSFRQILEVHNILLKLS